MKSLAFAFTVLLALSLLCAACGDDSAEPAVRYERVVSFDESPLAILADGSSVIVALPAELVRIDVNGRTPTRLTDGRYRECPWSPSDTWSGSGSGARVTARGDYLTFSAYCGSWAWPLAGGNVVPLVPKPVDFGAPHPQKPPIWIEQRVHVLRDGGDNAGWIAYGKTSEGSAMWSLGTDGAAREEIFRFTDDLSSITSSSDDQASRRVHVDNDAIYILVKPFDRTVRRAVLGRIDRASKTWSEVSTWKRIPSDPLDSQRVELAAVTPSHLVVLVDDKIFRVAKAGGAPEPIGACSGCSRFVSDASHLYWFDSDSLRRLSLEGANSVEDLLTLEGATRGYSETDLAVTQDAIWWTMREGPDPLQRKPVVARLPKP